ncbi:MAG: hypothetical protein K5839_01110 [Treponemataceae bacterium]|nr:hypothetical protein [Treponemataceae bacterium]
MKIPVKHIFAASLFAACIITSTFTSCQKKDEFADSLKNTDIVFKEITKKDHKWYYFTPDGFLQAALPQHAPQTMLKPWTEAIRISSSLSIENDAFMTVNKLGILNCDPANEKQASLSMDKGIFSNLTADNLTSVDGYPVFHVYKNQEFNNSGLKNSKNSKKANHPFLVQYHPESQIFVPLLSNEDLNIDEEAEVSSLVYKDDQWSATLKSSDAERKKFEYITFSTHEDLTNLSISGKKDLIQTDTISESEFRSKITPQDMSNSPERVQELFKRLPDNFSYYIQMAVANSGIQQNYVQSKDLSSPDIMESQVFLGDTYSIAIFTDGTGFFSGSLDDRYVVNNGNPVAFRLPKLPKNYTYGSLIIEGDILYVAWEESIFYETGRSGFLTVDLGNVFYDNDEI